MEEQTWAQRMAEGERRYPRALRDADKADWRRFANLRGFVRLVLCVDWDPIDLLGTPQTLDEYDSYAADIAMLLGGGATRADLLEHLKKIQMCKMPDLRIELVADKLLQVHCRFLEAQGRGAEPSV